jgi:exonuclease SbcC
MRPIKLRFSGLHSYRLPQEIDFTQLCSKGLFGIFGPTGSGKSTILDALTLALYGKVDRASNNTQGIINHACDTVTVDFIFELKGPQQIRRFRVERSYKRKDDTSVNVVHARFTELTLGAERVLADKDTTVTEKVKDLLGLTHDDFTKAVVLPQGKFAQFLSLQGNLRRQMLERIFSLEDYGEKMLNRIKTNSERVGKALENVTGEQKGLGDCSLKRVEEAKNELDETVLKVKSSAAALETVKMKYAEAEKKRQLQEKLTLCEQALNSLEEQSTEILRLKDLYERAIKAEPLRKELLSLTALKEEIQSALYEHQMVLSALQARQSRVRETEDLFRSAHNQKEERIPVLLVERAKLAGLLDDERLLKEVDDQYSELTDQHQILLKQMDEVKSEAEGYKAERAGLEEAIEKYKKEDEALQVSSGYRRKMNRLTGLLQQLEDSINECQQKEQEIEQAAFKQNQVKQELIKAAAWHKTDSQNLALENDRLQRLKSEPPVDEETLREEALFIEKARSAVISLMQLNKDLDSENQSLKRVQEGIAAKNDSLKRTMQRQKSLSEELIKVKNRLSELELTQTAFKLAQELQPGKPCLVCGSTHHPSVNKGEPHLTQMLEELEKQAASLTAELEKLKNEEIVLQAQVNGALEAEKGHRTRIEDLQERFDRAVGTLPGLWQNLSLDQIHENLITEEEGFNQRKAGRESWLAEVSKAETAVAELAKRAQKSAEIYNEAAQEYAAVNERLQNAQKAYEQAEKRKTLSERALNESGEGASVEQIKKALVDLEKQDEKREKIQGLLTRESEKKQILDEKIDRLNQKLHELDITNAKTSAAMIELSGKITELKSKIHEATQGESVEVLLSKINEEIQKIQNEYEKAAEEYNRAKVELNESEQQKASAEKALKLAETGYQKQMQSVREGLSQAGFLDIDQANHSLLDEGEKNRIKQEIDQYHTQSVTLQNRKKELEEEIGQSRLEESDWEAIQKEYDRTEQECNTALTLQGAKERDYLDVISKNQMWEELESKRQKLQERFNHLEQLAKVFRGKRFVEFIAEEYLSSISLDASMILGTLSRQRYALEVDSKGGFVIRDDANGGVRRPVSSLSGGETFLASLALALALSNQIQLAGTYPLEFFFLDEGFGTLDPGLLDEVISCLERMELKKVSIGIISHVPELYQRVSARIVVKSGVYTPEGSTLKLELG